MGAVLGAVGRRTTPGNRPPPIATASRPTAPPRGPEPDPELFDVLLDEVPPARDADGRLYPRLGDLPQPGKRELELALKQQWTELSARCIQIADLCNVQQQQAAELQSASNAIADLDKSVALLHAALSAQESETAAAKDGLARAEQDRAVLRAELESTQESLAQSHQHASALTAAFDQRGALLVEARQMIETLAAQLAAKTAEAEKLAAPIDEERRRHRDALTQQAVRFEIEIARLTRLLDERERAFGTLQDAHTRVAKRHEELSRSAAGFEAAQQTARDHVKSQGELIQVLEALLKVERDTAAGKIEELTAALDAERAARAELEKSSATMRRDIVHLLPKLVARNGETPASREDAA